MKTASAAMQAHLSLPTTTLAWLWQVLRRDGTIFGFTTHDRDIVYPPGAAASYYRSLTIDHTKVGASDSTNFPLLVSGTYSYLKTVANGGRVQSSSGCDIIFSTDTAGASLLNWEVESYDPATGTLLAWVKIPTLSHTADTVIYLHYGDATISTFQGGAAGAAWDSNFKGVYHLGSSLTADSTSNGNNGTLSSTPPTSGTGQIGGAAALAAASSEYIDLGASASLAPGPTGLTYSAWVKIASFHTNYNPVIERENGGGSEFTGFFVKDTGNLAVYLTPANYDGSGSHTLSVGSWYYLTITYDTTAGLKGYVNGALDGSAASGGALATSAIDVRIGSALANSGQLWDGLIDEVRISNVARSADWITAEYNNQSTPASFYALGSETSTGGGGPTPVTYQASTGFTNSNNVGKSDLTVDNMEVAAFLSSDSITEDDLRNGLFDDATVQVSYVNWADLTMGRVITRTGTLGIVKMKNGLATSELRGLAHKLGTKLGATYGPVCRATFGSGLNGIDINSPWLCMVDVTLYRQSGSVASVSDSRTLTPAAGLLMRGSPTPTAAAPIGWFNDGIITFTSGPLNGGEYEIKLWNGTKLELFEPLPAMPNASDTFTIEPGCDKTTVDCQGKFVNIANMRAEPFIPGNDQILNYAYQSVGGG